MGTTANGLPYPASGDAPNGSAQIQALAQAIETYFGGTRASYTPTLGWTNTTPTAVYTRVGALVCVEFILTLTGTPVGTFSMTLPTTAIAAANRSSCGTALFRDNSVGDSSMVSGTVFLLSTTTVSILSDQDATSAVVTPTNPFTFATSDTIGGTFWYAEA